MKIISTFLILFLCFSSNTRAQNIIVDYQFNGVLADSSTNGNHLTIFSSGNSVDYSQGITSSSSDSAISFNEGQGLVSTKSINNSTWSGEAITLWIKECGTGNIFQGANWGVGINSASDGKIRTFFDGNSGGSLASSTALNDGNWHFIVCQNNGTVTEMYIDGVLDVSQNEILYKYSGGGTSLIYLGLTNLQISKLDGQVDNIKVYDNALTSSQIRDLHQSDLASMKAKIELERISIYPNPTCSEFAIQNLPEDVNSYFISDISGRTVQEGLINGGSFNTNSISSGTYFINVADKNQVILARGKFLKN